MSLRCLLVAFAAAFMAACAATPAVMPLPEPDVAAIRHLQANFIAACRRSAWTELPAFFTDDATLLHAHEPAVQGIGAIREHYRNLKLRALEANAQPDVISGSGDFAYLRGSYDGVFQTGTTAPVSDAGAFMWVLRKQNDGAWKIVESASVPLAAKLSAPSG